MISYAQNQEDVVLSNFFKDQKEGFYVDVGASDPTVRSVTKHFYDLGWTGINIEPVPRFYDQLVKERERDVNLCVAVGSKEDTLSFFEFEAEGISTLNQDNADHFTNLGYPSKKITVDVVTLASICEKYCTKQIDFLKIDVEGWEKEVIEGGDWKNFRPRVVLLEAIKPNSNIGTWHLWEPQLLSLGYVFCYFDGINRFYIRQEDKDLIWNFP